MKDENKVDFKKIASENWIEPPRRERKRKYANCQLTNKIIFLLNDFLTLLFVNSYSESEYFKQTMRQNGPARPKEPRIPRMPQL